jgi:hypothetical protein
MESDMPSSVMADSSIITASVTYSTVTSKLWFYICYKKNLCFPFFSYNYRFSIRFNRSKSRCNYWHFYWSCSGWYYDYFVGCL